MSKSKKNQDLASHDEQFSGGSGQALEASSFDPSMLSVESFNTMINSDVIKPSWKINKYPVPVEEFKDLQKAAEKPDEPTTLSLEAADKSSGDTDEMALMELNVVELPEDGNPGPDAPAPLAPTVLAGFAAIPATGWVPPDCVCAAGPNHVVAAVNAEFRIYSKTGGFLRRTTAATFFSPVLPAGAAVKVFDPRIVYDHYNGRYLMIFAAILDSPARSWCCVAISKTNDPMGAWWIYALDASVDGSTATTNWMDYPMLGFDPNAVYIGMNQFKVGGGFQYAKIRILNKSELYNGGSVRWYDFWNLKNPDNSGCFAVQPCSHFRGAGAGDAYFINAIWPASNKLTVWTLNNPLAFWSGGSPTLSKVSVNCRSYDIPPQAKQSGSATAINTNDSRMLSAMYQNAGGVLRIWAAHTSKISWAGDTEARSAVQWYEIDVPTKTVIQQNGYGQAGAYYFYPAIQTDLNRNAYIVFGRCTPTEFASARLTGRRVGLALGTLDGSVILRAGSSAHTSGRYGDYFGMGRDGADAGRVWGIGEYAETGGNWGTFVTSAKY